MTDIYDTELNALNEVRRVCCDASKCSNRYWEACWGIRRYFGRIEGCAVAVSKYYEILGKLKERADK